MKSAYVFLAVLLGLLGSAQMRSVVKRDEGGGKRIVCYYTNWSVYRPESVRFSISQIDPKLCTHVLYAFALPDDSTNGIMPSDAYQDLAKGGFKEFVDLKKENPDLKTMISVGGWNAGSAVFSELASSNTTRTEFVKNSIKFLRQHGFDGVDLVWQYPTFRHGSRPEDKDNYALLIKELREEMDKEAKETGKSPLIISVVMSGLGDYMTASFDKDALNKYADFINVVAYDYYTASGPVVNHHSSLYSVGEDPEDPIRSQLNVDASVKTLLKEGYLAEKLNLGVPTYGRLFTLEFPTQHKIGSPAVGDGMGNTTSEAGYIPYYELCSRIKEEKWQVEYSQEQGSGGPYAYKDKLWVGYDTEESAKQKGEYARSKNLGGLMFWTIDHDDFLGRCQESKYPLIKAASNGINKV